MQNSEKKMKPIPRKKKPVLIPPWTCPTGKTTSECRNPALCTNCYHFGISTCQHPVGAAEKGSYYKHCFTCKYLKAEFISVKCEKEGGKNGSTKRNIK